MQAAVLCGMDRQTLRDWVRRRNHLGLDGLEIRRPPGQNPRLTSEQESEVFSLWCDGSRLYGHGVVRWRSIDLPNFINMNFGVHLAQRNVDDFF